jgi:hypothetical protein
MRLHCDEDDGGDGFLMVLTGTSLYYQERGIEKRSMPYLGRQSLRICKIDRFENDYKDAYLMSNYLSNRFYFYFFAFYKYQSITAMIAKHFLKCSRCQNNVNSRNLFHVSILSKTSLFFPLAKIPICLRYISID